MASLRNHLLGLPNEIWIKIIGSLNEKDKLSASLVSAKMRQLALEPALWTGGEFTKLKQSFKQRFKQKVAYEVTFQLTFCCLLRND
jgi:hypothetical protein